MIKFVSENATMVLRTFMAVISLSLAAKASELDDTLHSYEKQFPAPSTISEANGVSLKCDQHGHVTYTLLYALGMKLPVKQDSDLITLLPWLQHEDTCIRYIALTAAMNRIGYNSNASGNNERDSYLFYDIVVAIKAFLDKQKVVYDGHAFDALPPEIDPKKFGAQLNGKWVQDVNPKSQTMLYHIEISDGRFILKIQHTESGSATFDSVWSKALTSVQVNAQRQYVLKGEWDNEPGGFDGATQKTFPNDLRIYFIRDGVMWFRRSEKGFWDKFKKE